MQGRLSEIRESSRLSYEMHSFNVEKPCQKVDVSYTELNSNNTATATPFLGPRSVFYTVTRRSSPKNNQSWQNRKILYQYNRKKEIQVCCNVGSNIYKLITTTRLIGWPKNHIRTFFYPLIPTKNRCTGIIEYYSFFHVCWRTHLSHISAACVYFRYLHPNTYSPDNFLPTESHLWFY